MKRGVHQILRFCSGAALAVSLLAISGCFEAPRVQDPDRRIASFSHAGMEGASCNQCHEKDRPVMSVAPITLGGEPGAPVSGGEARPVHGNGGDCLQCHKTGSSWSEVTSYDHKDPTLSCSKCHESKRPAPIQGVVHGGGADCMGCHRPGPLWKDVLAYAHNPLPSDCRICHETSRPAFTAFPIPANRVSGHFGNQDCAACHVVGGTAGQGFRFQHVAANSKPVSTCLPCHEARRKSPTHYAGQDCSACHLDPAKPWLLSIKSPHPANVPMPTSCNGCHEGERPSSTRIGTAGPVLTGHFSPQDCVGCHAPKSATLNIFQFNHRANGKTQTACGVCHESKRPSADHYPGRDCASCHTNPDKPWYLPTASPHPQNSPMPARCNTCHEGERPTTTLYPIPAKRVQGHFAGQDCTGCHEARTATLLTFKFAHQPSGKPRSSCVPCHEGRRPTAAHFAGQDCVNCHSNPTVPWSNTAASPHPANSPAVTACLGCHEKDRPSITTFPAPGGSAAGHFGTAECFGCHRPKSATLAIFKFDHQANGVARTSCLPCHEAGRPAGMVQRFNHTPYGAEDCVKCHKQTTTWVGGIFTHVPAPTTCTECHSGDRPSNLVNRFSHALAGTGDCVSCHTKPGSSWTGGTFGHTPRPTTCSNCHESNRPVGLVNRFEHGLFGQGECASCHTNPGVTWKDSIYGHSPRPLGCAVCHASDRPATVVKRFDHTNFGKGDCVSCHEQPGGTWAGGVYAHSPVPASCSSCHTVDRPAGAVNGFSHATFGMEDCAGCHKQPGITWGGGIYTHTPAPTTCNSCHASDRPVRATARFDHAKQGTGDCVNCHKPGATWVGGTFSHSPVPATCNSCHVVDRPAQVVNRFDHAQFGTGDCTNCHKQPGVSWAGGLYTHSPVPATCTSCHSTDRPAQAVNGFSHATLGSGDCIACHTQPGTTWAGGAYTHSPVPGSCTNCHETDRPAATALFPAGATKNRYQHATQFNGAADCKTCHLKVTANLGVTWSGGYWDHMVNGAKITTTCLPCHASEAPAGTVPNTRDGFVHNATFMGGTTDCIGCHTQVTANIGVSWTKGFYSHVPVPTTCSPCHDTKKHKAGEVCTRCHTVGTYVKWPKASATGSYGGSWGSP